MKLHVYIKKVIFLPVYKKLSWLLRKMLLQTTNYFLMKNDLSILQE